MAVIIVIDVAFLFSKKPPETRSTGVENEFGSEMDFEKNLSLRRFWFQRF